MDVDEEAISLSVESPGEGDKDDDAPYAYPEDLNRKFDQLSGECASPEHLQDVARTASTVDHATPSDVSMKSHETVPRQGQRLYYCRRLQ